MGSLCDAAHMLHPLGDMCDSISTLSKYSGQSSRYMLVFPFYQGCHIGGIILVPIKPISIYTCNNVISIYTCNKNRPGTMGNIDNIDNDRYHRIEISAKKLISACPYLSGSVML